MGKGRDSDREERRWRALGRVQEALEVPMIVLGLVWAALLFLELYKGLSPLQEALSLAIWAVFAADFLVEIAIAPSRVRYLKANALTALSLFAPAFRVFRAVRLLRAAKAARLARPISLLRIVASANRSMSILKKILARGGFGYVIALSAVIVLLGAAGMYNLEKGSPGFGSFGESLWWSAMILTTMGTQYWPLPPKAASSVFFWPSTRSQSSATSPHTWRLSSSARTKKSGSQEKLKRREKQGKRQKRTAKGRTEPGLVRTGGRVS
jgi:voltage-gated potassium channel